ncbi:hypothetical protein D3C76_1392740 [compost metagenome]
MHFGINQPWPHGIYADALRSHLQRQPGGKRVYRPFGGGIVDVFSRSAEARGSGRDIDDRPALAAMTLRHALHRLTATEKITGNVGT